MTDQAAAVGGHTPGPWRVSDKLDGYARQIFADTRKSIPVAIVSKGGRISEERDANAALIVRAVNSHAIFEQALREIVDSMSADAAKYQLNWGHAADALETARAALKQSEAGNAR